MTYTTYKTTTQNPPAGISEPAWKDPVSGHDYKNDPERDNHLFDSHKAYHAKDDGQRINQILKQLKELGGDYGFNPDFKNNPKGKMAVLIILKEHRKVVKHFQLNTTTVTLNLIPIILLKTEQ